MDSNNGLTKWSRFLGRFTDYALLLLILTPFLNDFVYIGAIIFLPLLWFPIEGILLKTWGTTPGKALFGIKVRKGENQRLSWKESFKRSFTSALRHTPIFSLYGIISFFKQSKRVGYLQSDQEAGITVSASAKKRKVGVRAVIALLCFTGMIATQDRWEGAVLGHRTVTIDGMKWKQFNAPKGNFIAYFPKAPKTITKNLAVPGSTGSLPYHEFRCIDDENVDYSVSHTTLPDSWMKWSSGLLLKGALKILSGHSGAKVTKKRSFRNHGYPAINYTLTKGSKEYAGVLMLVGRTLYRAEVGYDHVKKIETERSCTSFLYSFDPKKEVIEDVVVEEKNVTSSQPTNSTSDIPQSPQ